jgi:hypothetical protein
MDYVPVPADQFCPMTIELNGIPMSSNNSVWTVQVAVRIFGISFWISMHGKQHQCLPELLHPKAFTSES